MTALAASSLAAALAVCALAGCGGSEPDRADRDRERPTNSRLTYEEASRLAQVLVRNTQAGGARISATLPLTATTDATLRGRIDFVHTRAALRVAVREGDRDPSSALRVYFTPRRVLTQATPQLRRRLKAGGLPRARFISEPAAQQLRLMDRAYAYLASLATRQADNPLLVQQGKARWVRADRVNGRAVEVVRFGPLTTYWIDPANGEMVRASAKLSGFAAPVTVTFLGHGTERITLPPAGQVVRGKDARRVTR